MIYVKKILRVHKLGIAYAISNFNMHKSKIKYILKLYKILMIKVRNNNIKIFEIKINIAQSIQK